MAGPSGSTGNLKLPYPIGTDTVDVPRDVRALAEAIDPLGHVPVGAMTMWPAAAPPTGWLLCQGQKVAAATYPQLATLLGQDGSGNVTMPDMRDVFPVGAGATALGSTGGAAAVALSVAQLPSHNHNGATGSADRSLAHTHGISGNVVTFPGQVGAAGTQYIVGSSFASYTNNDPAPDHLHSIAAQGGGGTHENRPPYRALNFIIRAG